MVYTNTFSVLGVVLRQRDRRWCNIEPTGFEVLCFPAQSQKAFL